MMSHRPAARDLQHRLESPAVVNGHRPISPISASKNAVIRRLTKSVADADCADEGIRCRRTRCARPRRLRDVQDVTARDPGQCQHDRHGPAHR